MDNARIRIIQRDGLLRRTLRWIASSALLIVIFSGAWFYVPDPGDDAPRVLVSVDRTLWNRTGLNRWTYVRALRKAGLRPVLVEFGELPPDSTTTDWLGGMDGLLLSGGGDVAAVHYGGDESISRDVNPDRDAFELQPRNDGIGDTDAHDVAPSQFFVKRHAAYSTSIARRTMGDLPVYGL